METLDGLIALGAIAAQVPQPRARLTIGTYAGLLGAREVIGPARLTVTSHWRARAGASYLCGKNARAAGANPVESRPHGAGGATRERSP